MNFVQFTLMRRLTGFALVPLLSLLASIAILPLIAHRFGPPAWSSLTVGQSIGAFAGVVTALAWPIVGPHMVAASEASRRIQLYRASLKSRGYAALVVFPLTILVVLTLQPANLILAVTAAVSVAMNGFSAAWYFAGTGEGFRLSLNEGLLRLCGYLVGLTALLLGAPVSVYGGILVLVSLLMLAANNLTILGSAGRDESPNLEEPSEGLSFHVKGGASRLGSAAFNYLPVPMVAALAPSMISVVSALDQVHKTVLNASNFVPQALTQSVTSRTISGAMQQSRARIFLGISCLIAVLSAGIWFFVLPLALHLLFAGYLDLSPEVYLASAIYIGALVGSQFMGNLVMVPLGVVRWLYRAIWISSVVGIAGVLIAAGRGDMLLYFLALAASALALVLVEIVTSLKSLRRQGV